MSSASNTATSVALTFFITLGLNTALNYYSSDRGTIGISRAFPAAGKHISVVSIENYTRDFIDDVAIEVPSAVLLSELASDSAVSLIESPAPHQGRTRIVKIGQVSPRLVTRVFVPLPDHGAGSLLRVVNPEASGLSVRVDDELESPLRRALLSALVVAAMYALFAVGIAYYTNRRTKALEDEASQLEKQVDSARKRLNQVEARVVKHRLLLQARLFDYSKELDFWRNTMRSLLQRNATGTQNSDELIALVTASLKTYGAAQGAHSFEAVRVAAAWLVDSERIDADADQEAKAR